MNSMSHLRDVIRASHPASVMNRLWTGLWSNAFGQVVASPPTSLYVPTSIPRMRCGICLRRHVSLSAGAEIGRHAFLLIVEHGILCVFRPRKG